MAASESIDEFISPAAWEQWERLHKEAKQSVEEMERLGKAAIAAFDCLNSPQTFSEMTRNITNVSNSNKDLRATVISLNGIYDQFGKVVGISSNSIKENATGLVSAKNELKDYQNNLNKANAALKDGTLSYEKYTEVAIKATEAIARASADVLDYSNAINTEVKASNLASVATQKLTAEIITNRLAVTTNNAELKKQIQFQQAVPGSIAEARLQTQLWRSELVNLNLTTDEGIARQKELIALIDEKDTFIAKNVDKYTAQKINIGNYPDAVKQIQAMEVELNALTATGQENSVEWVSLAAKITEVKAAMGGVSGELALVTKQLTELAAAGKQDSAEFSELTAKAVQLKAAVKEVQAAIGNGLQSNATVSSLTTTRQQLTLVTTKMQEMVLAGKADSQEFRALALEAQRLTAALAEVNISIKGVTTVGDKFISIVERMGLRMIANMLIFQTAIEVLQFLTQWITNTDDASVKAKEALDQYKDSLVDMINTVNANYEKEVSKTKELFETANNVALSYNYRVETINKLLQLYPDLLTNLEREAFLNGQLSDKYAKIAEVQSLTAAADRSQQDIDLKTKRINDLQKEIDKDRSGDFFFSLEDNSFTKEKQEIKELKDQINDLKIVAHSFREEADLILHPAKVGKDLSDLKEALANEENKLQTMSLPKGIDENTPASMVDKILGSDKEYGAKVNAIIAKIKNLREEIKKIEGKDKEPKNTLNQDLNAQYQAEKVFNDAVYNLEKQRYKQDANDQQLIMDNEKETLQKRLEAVSNYYKDMTAIAILENGRELADLQAKEKEIDTKIKAAKDGRLKLSKIAFDALLTESAGYDIKILEKQEDLKNKLAAITLQKNDKDKSTTGNSNETWLKNEDEGLQERIFDLDKQYAAEKAALDKSLDDKLISYETYEKKLKKLKQQAKETELKEKIAEDTYKLADGVSPAPLSIAQKAKIQKDLNQKNEELTGLKKPDAEKGDLVADAGKMLGLDPTQSHEAAADIISLEQEVMKASHARYEQEITDLEKKKALIDQSYDTEINSINGAFMSEQKKAMAISILQKEKQQQDLQIHNQEVAIKRKMAEADKAASVASIVANTAIGVTKAWADFPPPFDAIMAAVVAAAGATQLAVVLSTPLPSYATGTEDHPGGKAILGDAFQKELVAEPGKTPYWSADKPTVYDLPAHTRVIPEAELLAGSLGLMTPNLLSSLNIVNNNDFTALEQTTKQGFTSLENAIMNKRENHFHWRNGELRKSVKNGNAWTTFLNSNF